MDAKQIKKNAALDIKTSNIEVENPFIFFRKNLHPSAGLLAATDPLFPLSGQSFAKCVTPPHILQQPP